MLKARVLYDFEGQPGTSELSIYAGEIVTVTSKDVGEGWWEGSNQRGVSGIFPAAYVEVRMKEVFKLNKSIVFYSVCNVFC